MPRHSHGRCETAAARSAPEHSGSRTCRTNSWSAAASLCPQAAVLPPLLPQSSSHAGAAGAAAAAVPVSLSAALARLAAMGPASQTSMAASVLFSECSASSSLASSVARASGGKCCRMPRPKLVARQGSRYFKSCEGRIRKQSEPPENNLCQ